MSSIEQVVKIMNPSYATWKNQQYRGMACRTQG